MKRFLLTQLVVLCGAFCLSANAEPALAELPVRIGQARVDSPGGYGIYSVSVSGPMQEKSQEIRFIAYWDGPDLENNLPRNRTTRTATVKSGKSKTLGQTITALEDAFDRFLAAPKNNARNQALLKIGDIKYGGELVVVAETGDVLRFDYVMPSGNTSIRFGKNEVVEFAKLMKSR